MSTNLETQATTREKVRVFVTGSCDGLAELRDALERHGEVEVVGWSDTVLDSASTLTGGHLQVVLHGTRSSTLPSDELAAIREHSPAPVILLASGESSVLLDEALDADVSDVLLLPQMTENVIFAIRKASHSGRKAGGGHLLPDDAVRPAARDPAHHCLDDDHDCDLVVPGLRLRLYPDPGWACLRIRSSLHAGLPQGVL